MVQHYDMTLEFTVNYVSPYSKAYGFVIVTVFECLETVFCLK